MLVDHVDRQQVDNALSTPAVSHMETVKRCIDLERMSERIAMRSDALNLTHP
jgi:hypothetical protein